MIRLVYNSKTEVHNLNSIYLHKYLQIRYYIIIITRLKREIIH